MVCGEKRALVNLPMSKNEASRLIYSPVEQIPLGEPAMTPDGRPAIKVRHTTKRKQHKEEIIPLDYIFAQTVNASADRNPQKK